MGNVLHWLSPVSNSGVRNVLSPISNLGGGNNTEGTPATPAERAPGSADMDNNGTPDWFDLDYASKYDWKQAGKPREAEDQPPSMFKSPGTPWNPNPGHAANHMFSGQTFTGLQPAATDAASDPTRSGGLDYAKTLGKGKMQIQPYQGGGLNYSSLFGGV